MAHLPARTPYARKAAGGGLAVVNNSMACQGHLPQDMSVRWLRERTSFEFFDVLHVRSLEPAAAQDIEAVLDSCDRDSEQGVCTIHAVRWQHERPSARRELWDLRAAEHGASLAVHRRLYIEPR